MHETSEQRCKRYRRRILDLSQQVPAMHIGSAFSCLELVDVFYNALMQTGDTFIMSKGHGWMAQAVVLEDKGILPPGFLDRYCTPDGPGVHPDLGIPGIACATGSLGHGLGMAVGMALAERSKPPFAGARLMGAVDLTPAPSTIYVILSDGELQEGSTWEAILLASSLQCGNLVVAVDNNDLQSLGRTSETHPSMYPIKDKFESFGWDADWVKGHDSTLIQYCIKKKRTLNSPMAIIADTVKGKGVSYMEDEPIWHYRSPSPQEYRQAMEELA